jgi:hypothetical protein
MSDTPTPPRSPRAAQPAAHRAPDREQLRRRVDRYKRRAVIAAIVGFGMVSLLIANPDLGIAAPSSTTSQQDPGNFLNQQGGNSYDNGTSQQPPSTRSQTS